MWIILLSCPGRVLLHSAFAYKLHFSPLPNKVLCAQAAHGGHSNGSLAKNSLCTELSRTILWEQHTIRIPYYARSALPLVKKSSFKKNGSQRSHPVPPLWLSHQQCLPLRARPRGWQWKERVLAKRDCVDAFQIEPEKMQIFSVFPFQIQDG